MDLRSLLVETYAHMPPANILADVSEQNAMRHFTSIPHSIAEIVAHLDFWQRWFLRRCRGESAPMAASASLGWPNVAEGGWTEVRERFASGTEEAAALAGQAGLEQPVHPAIEFPPLAGYTVREALVHVASHNSHHLGQVILLRQLMGSWPPPSGSWTW
jgi:uncharacterized damage-inducible protein DinB